jgi:biotin transport system substrate-specific component
MKTKNMVYVALFAALMIVMGMVPAIPLSFIPAPITIQTLGVMLAGAILGSRLGALSQIVFIMIIAVGVPGLSGGRGGFSVFSSPTVGFLISWPVAAFIIGFILERVKKINYTNAFLANFIGGVIVIYAIGIPVMSLVTNTPIVAAIKGSLIFIPGDLIKVAISTILSTRISNTNVLKSYNK